MFMDVLRDNKNLLNASAGLKLIIQGGGVSVQPIYCHFVEVCILLVSPCGTACLEAPGTV
jgi:hypothetical protein